MDAIRLGRGRRPGGDHGDRGRDRRPQRDRDAGRGSRALRPLAAPPAARPGGPRRARVLLHPLRRPGVRRSARRGSTRSPSEGDGFALAEVDLSIRGEGEILGTRQHGLPRFRAATLPEDTALLLEARRRVLELRERHGSLEAPSLGPLMDEARRRFGDERRRADRGVDARASDHGGRAGRPADPRARGRPRAATDDGARPRGGLLDPRRYLRRPGAGPVQRQRGAGDRGALPGRRRRRRWSIRARPRLAATSSRSASATGPRWSGRTRCASCAAPSRNPSISCSAIRPIDSPTALPPISSSSYRGCSPRAGGR